MFPLQITERPGSRSRIPDYEEDVPRQNRANCHLADPVTEQDAEELLEERGFFHVYLSFVDPRVGQLVEGLFCFYPKPQSNRSGTFFITEHEGLALRIPSDMRWYSENQNKGYFEDVNQQSTILVNGEVRTVSFTLEVSTCIRLLDNPSFPGKVENAA